MTTATLEAPTQDEIERVIAWQDEQRRERLFDLAARFTPENAQLVFMDEPIDPSWPAEALIGLLFEAHRLADTLGEHSVSPMERVVVV